ncbi:MAG: TonB family protein [Anaerolineae bacterium]|nr:TonB family protein [Gloeobacterales cyanobacterium ES-bin-313]
MGKLKTEALPFDVMRSCCFFLLIVSTLIAAPSFAQKLPAALQKQVDKGFLTRGEAELLNSANSEAARTLCREGDGVNAGQDETFSSYIATLKLQVRRFWKPEYILPSSGSSYHGILTFDVKRNGKIDNLHVTCSSGNRVYDQYAVKAIERSAPFNPLPKTYKEKKITINFTFDMSFKEAF